jgi:hypothetical protein
MRFFLGTDRPHWLEVEPYLFISRRTLSKKRRKTFPVATGPWALDSGGFTELSLYGEWRTTEDEYVADVRRFEAEIGSLEWAAPQDWMCEPVMLQKTGLDVAEHQRRTVANFLSLRERLGPLVIPVLQGFERDDYLRCVEMYAAAGADLTQEPTVGLGSVCRRQDTKSAAMIVRALEPIRLHGFGVKKTGLKVYADGLVSADSHAWSVRAWRGERLPECTHRNCCHCLPFARRWRQGVEDILGQGRLGFA